MTNPTALAAPVEDGIIFWEDLPPLQSFLEAPSTTYWVAVEACTVVMSPSSIPKASLTTLASGAKQLVVQEALETMF